MCLLADEKMGISAFKFNYQKAVTWKFPLSSVQLSLASGPPTRAPWRTWGLHQ